MDKPKITYPDRYNEPIEKADEIIASIADFPPQTAVETLLLFLIEYSQLWHKAKCAAMEYCIEQYADTANGYAERINKIKAKILEYYQYKR